MKVKELMEALSSFPDDLPVFTVKEEVFGTIGCTNNVKEDEYAFIGVVQPCVIITDRYPPDEV